MHRDWYERSAMGDLLGRSGEAIELQSLYRCQDKLLAHKMELFNFLKERWENLFRAEFEVLLYDQTSTYFECDPPLGAKRRFGYSRDKRPDCVQVIIALVVTPEGLPLAYEVMAVRPPQRKADVQRAPTVHRSPLRHRARPLRPRGS